MSVFPTDSSQTLTGVLASALTTLPHDTSQPLTGVLAGPIGGLKYETPKYRGLTDEKGQFRYDAGDRVVFLLGNYVIGTCKAEPRIHLAQIVSRVNGDLQKLKDPGMTNIARLVYTCGQRGDRDHGCHIAPQVHDIIGDRPLNFRSDFPFVRIEPDYIEAFTSDPITVQLLEDLNEARVFDDDEGLRQLVSPANARNELRRNALGILRFRDVKIPLQNGLYVLADVFRPAEEGNYPVIMNCGVYGKAFNHHSVGNPAELETHEHEEDEYFFGNSLGQIYENHETVNTAVWVPKGYSVVRVDGPGTGNNPGTIAVWGLGTATAYYDAIEWAGVQPWSNGNVGLWGMSYYAVTQQAVASLQPPHLKAMISMGTDIDLYEEIAYTGGLLNENFFPFWFRALILTAVCGKPDAIDIVEYLANSPFKDSDLSKTFGPKSEVFMSPDMSKVTVPLWAVVVTTHQFNFHQLGSSEAFIHTKTPHKKLDFWEDWFTKAYSSDSVRDHSAFFDYWLKGIDNGIMDTPPVRLEIRTGNGASFIQEEDEWPIARTEYRRYYLDATPAQDFSGNGWRDDHFKLSTSEVQENREASYNADVRLAESRILRGKPSSFMDPYTTGICFVSEVLEEDITIAGYGKIKLWVSSSTEDMDLYITIRILDEKNREVDFAGPTTMSFPDRIKAFMKGWLKVSHRKIDSARTTNYTVKHTHLKGDYAPLKPDEIVPVEIEISPNTAYARKGHRIQLEVQPHDGAIHGVLPHECNPVYHKNSFNKVYTGGQYDCWVQLPVVPRHPLAVDALMAAATSLA
ncbi:MAG: hypothetical protein TREMPRED_002760 [Tremellales sp. Tagirdzhanova-0007]|nr:MAG: hypothetical protein TREMPRED_002760 [Tremellales sp. Tagirdzhanova-0007]